MSDQMSEPDGKSSTDIVIEIIPNEVLFQIFGYLDTPPPSSRLEALRDEPSFEITKSDSNNLKAISLVSRRWRALSIPILFKHLQFTVREDTSLDGRLGQKIMPLFVFITSNSLNTILSFTLIVHDKAVTDKLPGDPRQDFALFWFSLFQVIDPTDLLIVAPPEALGRLTSCRVFLGDEDSFECQCHYLRLQMSPRTSGTRQWKGCERILTEHGDEVEGMCIGTMSGYENLPPGQIPSSALFSMRPWDKLLLNEGSFIKAYLEVNFDRKKIPSILPDLVGVMNGGEGLISPTVRDMSYVAIFPMSSHFCYLANNMPRLDRLYTQIVPQNQTLRDLHKVKNLRQDLLWIERNGSYAWLMQNIFSTPPRKNYQELKILESGDQADRRSWEMAAQSISRGRLGWKIEGDGVLVKNPEAAQPTNPIIQNIYNHNPMIFNYALERWAWNGTANIPVSTQSLYRYGQWP